ncbi:MAG: TonB-dependent receptor [Bryobacterales bacterium]|nr:TonB-dependent receptor [Bryobacterales bacterium]
MSSSLPAATIRGRVIDAATGEPIHRALVKAGAAAATAPDGRFKLDVAGGPLQVTCVGYRPFVLERLPETAELEVRLVPDTLRRTESIDVAAGPYAPQTTPSVNLAGGELRNLASVLADDPLRAVQGLPGVTSNDDFTAQISLRAAGFQRLGVYLDGVVLHSPFHTVQGEAGAGSLTMLSSDMLEQVELHAGPIPLPFADRTAGALDMRYRDGDRRRRFIRGSASASNANASLEGPLQNGRGSWLVSLRKSYLQYLIQSTADDPTLAFGFWDMQGRLSYDVTPAHRVSLNLVHGQSGLNREGAENTLGLNSIFKTDYRVTLANAGSRWTPNARWLLQNNLAWMREGFDNGNRQANPLSGGRYREWVWNSDNTWQQGEHATILFGANLRRIHDEGFLNRVQTTATRIDGYNANAFRAGVHAGQELRIWTGRVVLRAGGRADRHDAVARTTLSPHAAVGLALTPRTRLNLGFGAAAQFPEISQLFARSGVRFLLPERAQHVQASVEQRLDERTRFRAELWQRVDRDLLFRPLFEPRITQGRIYAGNTLAPWANSQRGYARGAQVFLQRRSANGVTGWVSYAYTAARLRDGVLNLAFAPDYQQKHAVNVFTSYRLRPTINLSARWSYGSGFPIRGFFAGGDAQYRLSAARNDLRIPAYHRLDIRANKTYIRKGWQMTLYAEAVNLYNRRNSRFDDLRSVDARTGVARLGFDRMFPILPSAGLAIEF